MVEQEAELGAEPFIKLEMLSNPQYLSGARDLIAAVAKRTGFSDIACCQIALAVDEALCNIIRHGYKRQLDGKIWVELYKHGDDGGLRIVIEDEAEQIEPHQIKGRDLEDVKPGGLGVHIIREVMDEVIFEKRDGVGMRLTLIKIPSGNDELAPDACMAPSAEKEGCGDG